MNKRKTLLCIGVCYFGYALAQYIFPPFTVSFWRLACTSDVAFSVVGMGGSISSQLLSTSEIDRSICPGLSYRILFWVGTPAAKCHALVGIRDYDRTVFPDYFARLQASDAIV